MSRPTDTVPARGAVPEAEIPDSRTDEQELAAGRSAATPFAAILGVVLLLATVVTLVLALVVVVVLLR